MSFHLLFHESWDGKFLREYRKAVQYYRAIQRDAVRRIFIVSYSRSGTHNFCTRFHYLPQVFVFGENVFFDRDRDPYQLKWSWSRTRAVHFQYASPFLQQGLQDKRGEQLTHVLLHSNHYLKCPNPLDPALLQKTDRVIFYQRNFVRTLFSQDKAGRKYNKPHFVMTDEHYRLALERHRRKLDEMLRLSGQDPERFRIFFHERFCAQPLNVFREACGFAGIPPPGDAGLVDPLTFFKRCYRTQQAPELRDGKLWCAGTGEPILGKGGEYNPLPPVRLDRTIADPVLEWVSGERLALLRKTFGNELVEFWLNDETFDYEHTDQETLMGLLRSSKDG